MSRPPILAAALLFATLAAFGASAPAPADSVVNISTALPGPVANCQWFDDNLNDRAIDSLIRQTDLLYNRTALLPDQIVTITQTGTSTAQGERLVGFTRDRRLLCSDAQAFTPLPPAPSPSP